MTHSTNLQHSTLFSTSITAILTVFFLFGRRTIPERGLQGAKVILMGHTVSAKVRVDAFVSSAESVFQRRVGRKRDDFRHCRSPVSYYFRRAYIHVAEYLIRVLIRLVCFQGDRRVGMLSGWELSRMRVWMRRPTSARCNIVEYVLTGGWRMVQSDKRD